MTEKKPSPGSLPILPGSKAGTPIVDLAAIKLPNLKSELLSTRRATKTKGDAKPKKRFSSTAFNVTVQYIGACKKNKQSKGQKAYFRFGNLTSITITPEASSYVVQDTENPDIIRLYPKYNEYTKVQWPGIEAKIPIHPEDYITLKSYGVFIISVEKDLCDQLSPGSFVTLIDLQFSVFATREDIPSHLKEKYKTPRGTIDWKKVPEDELAWNPHTHTVKPVFHFNAKAYQTLPSVSQASLDTLFHQCHMVYYYLPAPTDDELVYHNRYSVKKENYQPVDTTAAYEMLDEEIKNKMNILQEQIGKQNPDIIVDFAANNADALTKGFTQEQLKTRWNIYQDERKAKDHVEPSEFRMPDMFNAIPVYLIPFDGTDTEDPMKHVSGDTIQSLQTCYISKDDVNKYDAKINEESLERETEIGSNEFEKCLRFSFDAIQAIYQLERDDAGAIVGVYGDTPITKEKVWSRMNIYKRTLESAFGIYNLQTWKQFYPLYKRQLRYTVQCKVNWAKTKDSMERIQSLASGGVSSVAMSDDGLAGGADASLSYSHSYVWSCDDILMNYRALLNTIGIPISAKIAKGFTHKLAALRRNGSAPMGTKPTVNAMRIWNSQAVACLNEIEDTSKIISYIENPAAIEYVLVLLTDKIPSIVSNTIAGMVGEGSTPLGDQMVSILYDIDPSDVSTTSTTISFDPSIHDESIQRAVNTLIDNDFKKPGGSNTALLFGIWPMNKAAFTGETTTVAKFLGMPDQMDAIDAMLHPDTPKLGIDDGPGGGNTGSDNDEEEGEPMTLVLPPGMEDDAGEVDDFDPMLQPSQGYIPTQDDEGDDPFAEEVTETKSTSSAKPSVSFSKQNEIRSIPRTKRKRPARESRASPSKSGQEDRKKKSRSSSTSGTSRSRRR